MVLVKGWIQSMIFFVRKAIQNLIKHNPKPHSYLHGYIEFKANVSKCMEKLNSNISAVYFLAHIHSTIWDSKIFFFSLYSLRKQNHLTKLCHFRHVRFTISFHDIVLQFLHSLVFMLELNTTHKRHSPAGHHMSFHYNYPYNPYIDCGPLSSSNYFTVQVSTV